MGILVTKFPYNGLSDNYQIIPRREFGVVNDDVKSRYFSNSRGYGSHICVWGASGNSNYTGQYSPTLQYEYIRNYYVYGRAPMDGTYSITTSSPMNVTHGYGYPFNYSLADNYGTINGSLGGNVSSLGDHRLIRKYEECTVFGEFVPSELQYITNPFTSNSSTITISSYSLHHGGYQSARGNFLRIYVLADFYNSPYTSYLQGVVNASSSDVYDIPTCDYLFAFNSSHYFSSYPGNNQNWSITVTYPWGYAFDTSCSLRVLVILLPLGSVNYSAIHGYEYKDDRNLIHSNSNNGALKLRRNIRIPDYLFTGASSGMSTFNNCFCFYYNLLNRSSNNGYYPPPSSITAYSVTAAEIIV